MKKLFFFALLLITACASEPTSLEGIQSRLGTVRIIEKVPSDAVFGAMITTLKAEGYRIQSQDEKRGIILAVFEKSDKNSALGPILMEARRNQRGEVFEFNINLERNPKDIRVRYSLQRTAPYTFGGHEGEEILDPIVYDSFHLQVLRHLGLTFEKKAAADKAEEKKSDEKKSEEKAEDKKDEKKEDASDVSKTEEKKAEEDKKSEEKKEEAKAEDDDLPPVDVKTDEPAEEKAEAAPSAPATSNAAKAKPAKAKKPDKGKSQNSNP